MAVSCGLLPPSIECDGTETDCEEALAFAQTLLPRDIDRSRLIRATIDFTDPGPDLDAVARIELVYPAASGEQPMVMFIEREAPGEPFQPLRGVGP
jgi:hypothetical protein